MELANQDEILDEVDCILLHANVLEKGMNPFLLSIAMGK